MERQQPCDGRKEAHPVGCGDSHAVVVLMGLHVDDDALLLQRRQLPLGECRGMRCRPTGQHGETAAGQVIDEAAAPFTPGGRTGRERIRPRQRREEFQALG